jgi:histone arginine demethylase JMJD6
LVYNKDDSPLYLFESSFENHKELKYLLRDYKIPKYFEEDYFNLIDEDRRPPYRWFLIGPERSGTAIHFDPLGTSAWNASIIGYKLWLLLPPETLRVVAKGKEVLNGNDDEAIMYFREIFPKLKEKYGSRLKETIFIQKPGEIVFVPSGYWHVVVNLTDTIAVTQNYCNSVNFEKVWSKVRCERKKMAVKFLERLKEEAPLMHNKAIELNSRDSFVMYDKNNGLLKKKRSKNENSSSSSSSSSSSD